MIQPWSRSCTCTSTNPNRESNHEPDAHRHHNTDAFYQQGYLTVKPEFADWCDVPLRVRQVDDNNLVELFFDVDRETQGLRASQHEMFRPTTVPALRLIRFKWASSSNTIESHSIHLRVSTTTASSSPGCTFFRLALG